LAHQETPNKSPEQETPAWLLRVQEQSWEPEILVSGIVLYGLFQLPALLERLQHFLSHFSFEVFSGGTADESMIAVLKVANVWLIGGFMVHLLLRSIWVALVGLSYVYKNGVDITHLEKGLHYLELYYQSQEEGASVKSQQVAKVEFYKTQQAALIPAFTPELEE
jgi:hypothetical protein